MTLVEFANIKLSLEIVLAQVFIGAVIIYLLFFRKAYPAIQQFLGKWGLLLAFLAAFFAMSGSLFYSNIAGFTPCDLCWFQRICMYPLVAVLGLALLKRDRKIADYGLALAIIGWCISLYHNYIYYFNTVLGAGCLAAGKGTSCIRRFVFEFGYVTIPLMALTAFSLIIVFLLFYRAYYAHRD